MLRERCRLQAAEECLEKAIQGYECAVAKARSRLTAVRKELSAAKKAFQRSTVRRRRLAFLALRRKGLTYKEIGKRRGVSAGRAREIVWMAECEASRP